MKLQIVLSEEETKNWIDDKKSLRLIADLNAFDCINNSCFREVELLNNNQVSLKLIRSGDDRISKSCDEFNKGISK